MARMCRENFTNNGESGHKGLASKAQLIEEAMEFDNKVVGRCVVPA